MTGASQQALAVGLALAGSFSYAIAAVVQQRAAASLTSSAAFDPAILWRLIRSRRWQISLVAMTAGFGLQAAALAEGRLVLVEPVFPASLLFALLLAARLEGRWLRHSEWTAALATVAGLVVFLFAAQPSGGQRTAAASELTGAVIVSVLLAGLSYLVAHRFVGHHRALVLGLAGGIGAGVTDALTKTVAYVFSLHALGVFGDVRLYLLAVVGMTTFTLQQNGFRAASLGASLPAYALLEPVVGSILGIVIYDENVGLGPLRIIIEVLAVACATWGIIRLAQQAGTVLVATAQPDADVDSPDGEAADRRPADLDLTAPPEADGSLARSTADRVAGQSAARLPATPPVDPVS